MDEVTKRDLFAMAALQGFLACPSTVIKAHNLASQCFEIADAMLYEASGGTEGKSIPEPDLIKASVPKVPETWAKGSEDGGD